MKTYYVGMDVHKATIANAVLDASGKLVSQSVIETSTRAVRNFFSALQHTNSGVRPLLLWVEVNEMSVELRGTVTLIEVFDVRKSTAFYREMLGFEVHESAGKGEYLGWAWLKHGAVELMLNSMYDPGEEPAAPDPARAAAHRDTTLYFGCPDVEGAYSELRGRGVSVDGPEVTSYGMKRVSLRDPDGYGICLQWPTA